MLVAPLSPFRRLGLLSERAAKLDKLLPQDRDQAEAARLRLLLARVERVPLRERQPRRGAHEGARVQVALEAALLEVLHHEAEALRRREHDGELFRRDDAELELFLKEFADDLAFAVETEADRHEEAEERRDPTEEVRAEEDERARVAKERSRDRGDAVPSRVQNHCGEVAEDGGDEDEGALLLLARDAAPDA